MVEPLSHFFDEILTGIRYQEFKSHKFMLVLTVIFLNKNHQDLPNNNTWFQQDKTPPHFAGSIRLYLNNDFSKR